MPWVILRSCLKSENKEAGIIHAYLYRWISPAWPTGTVRSGISFALVTFLFWEFFTPFNLSGEPLGLIALELCFWAVIALADGFVISAIMDRGTSKPAGLGRSDKIASPPHPTSWKRRQSENQNGDVLAPFHLSFPFSRSYSSLITSIISSSASTTRAQPWGASG